MNDGLVLLQAKPLQHAIELIGPEDAHEIIFERQKEFGMAGIALPAGAAAQLVVDAPALMPLRAEHVEAARRQRLLLERRDLRTDVGGPRIKLALVRVLDVAQLLADAHVRIAANLN